MSLSTLVLLAACQTPPEVEAGSKPELPAAPVQTENAGRRIVAIGDLHGDRDASVSALKLAGLIDDAGHWIAGDTVFVQTGDTTDRGPDSRGVIDLLRTLKPEAQEAGGEIHMLLGNHEVMNLQGDWRYVSPSDIQGFGGKSNRMSAFSKSGEYGAFLETLPVAVAVDDTVFVHGGITPAFAAKGLEALNAEARAHYFDAPGPGGAAVTGENGPLWYRGYVRDPESTACPQLEAALKSLGAKRMVVGHTTQRDGVVASRCGGRLAVIDVGISAHYGGHVGIWESLDGDARFVTAAGATDLADP